MFLVQFTLENIFPFLHIQSEDFKGRLDFSK